VNIYYCRTDWRINDLVDQKTKQKQIKANRANQSTTLQIKANQSKSKQIKANQCKAKQSKT